MEIQRRYKFSEELLNSLSHAAGVVMGGVVCTVFLLQAYAEGSSLDIFSLWLYMFGVLSSYLASTLYHAYSAKHPNTKALLRKFDHAAIYWHIAGSYSPITLIAMLRGGATTWGWVIFGFVWLCAVVGTSLSFRKLKHQSYLETLCYVLMGLSILVAFKPFYECVGLPIVLWVVAEGVSYIVGAVLYSLKKFNYTHAIFHGFVLLGDVCHMVAVYKVLELFL